MELIPLTQDNIDRQGIRDFSRGFLFNPYRNYPTLSRLDGSRYIAGLVEDLICRESATSWGANFSGKLAGVGIVQKAQWETEYFGRKIADLRLFSGTVSMRSTADASRLLLQKAVEWCKNQKFELIMVKVDCEDFGSIRALQESNFYLVDTMLTYVFDKDSCTLPEHRAKYLVRDFEPKDEAALVSIAESAFKKYPNRFRVDAAFPRNAVDRYFSEWAKNMCNGSMADEMIVAEDSGRIVGFLGWRFQRDLQKYVGIDIPGRGLGATLANFQDAYSELLPAAVKKILQKNPACDYETQIFNHKTVNALEQSGFRYVRHGHTFHYEF